MSRTIVIDPWELDQAAQTATAMFDAADSASERLMLIGAGVEMPPDVAGRVLSMLTSASISLGAAAAIVERTARTLRRVAALARRADQGKVLSWGLMQLYGIQQSSLQAGQKVAPRSFPKGAEKVLKGAGRALGAASVAADVASEASVDARNPYLSDHQRAVRVIGAGVESAGDLAVVATAAAGGMAVGGPVGAFVAGAGAGIGVTVAGDELHVGNAIDSGVDHALGAADDAADAVGDFVGGIL